MVNNRAALLKGTSKALTISFCSLSRLAACLIISGLLFALIVIGFSLSATNSSSLDVLVTSPVSGLSSIAFLASALSLFSSSFITLLIACTSAILGSISFFTSVSKEYFLLLLSALGLTIFSFLTGSSVAAVASGVASTPASKAASAKS